MSKLGKRADVASVELKIAKTRSQAQDLIQRGLILLKGKKIKPGHIVMDSELEELRLNQDHTLMVSRAGEKLLDAISHFKVQLKGLRVLDVGQSTGGFTEAALNEGAKFVLGVDVGHNQLAPELVAFAKKNPDRMKSLSGINARALSESKEFKKFVKDKKDKFDVAVIDVSFISVRMVLPEVTQFLKSDGQVLILFKPQFELGKGSLDKRGVAKSKKAVQAALVDFRKAASNFGLKILSDFYLVPLRGKKGNQEFFIHAKPTSAHDN